MTFDSEELDLFASEDTSQPVEGVWPPGSVTLQELVDHNVPVHWDEAVAIVEELCGALISSAFKELPVPALSQIQIAETGSLSVRRPGRGEKSPGAAGRTLNTLLVNAEVPVALRLFVTQSIAPETYQSLGDFASALAYFGKPGRAELIQAVYQRYEETDRARAKPSSQAVARVAPVSAAARPVEKKPSTTIPVERWRLPRRLAPVAVACCVVAAGAWAWAKGYVATGFTEATSTAVTQETSAGSLATPGAPAASGSAASVAQPVVPTRRTARGVAELRRGTTKGSDVPQRDLDAAAPVFEIRSGSSRFEAPSLLPEASLSAVAPAIEEVTAAPAHSASVPDTSRTVYSIEDGDVMPPVLLYPQLPPPLFTSTSPNAMVNRMELVVAADGTVERVRLIDGPTRMPDMMLLSGAKVWKFTPALKDGTPVRYRTILSWSGFP